MLLLLLCNLCSQQVRAERLFGASLRFSQAKQGESAVACMAAPSCISAELVTCRWPPTAGNSVLQLRESANFPRLPWPSVPSHCAGWRSQQCPGAALGAVCGVLARGWCAASMVVPCAFLPSHIL